MFISLYSVHCSGLNLCQVVRLLGLCGIMQEGSVIDWFSFLDKIYNDSKSSPELIVETLNTVAVLFTCLTTSETHQFLRSNYAKYTSLAFALFL
jgi:hypothetical protein